MAIGNPSFFLWGGYPGTRGRVLGYTRVPVYQGIVYSGVFFNSLSGRWVKIKLKATEDLIGPLLPGLNILTAIVEKMKDYHFH